MVQNIYFNHFSVIKSLTARLKFNSDINHIDNNEKNYTIAANIIYIY